MAVRLQKSFAQPQFTVSCPSRWNSSELVPQFSSKNISFKVESSASPHIYHEAKHLGLQLLDQESSSTQSIGQSHDSVGAVGRTNSQDQCFSSESGENESRMKAVEGKMKPVFSSSPLDTTGNPPQADCSHSMVRAPCPYGDAYFGGLFTAYGPQSMIQPQMVPQMMAMTGARIPLPLDLADDGPVYVNAKQYHGILRRRQSRAKLEAQNKLVKTRKPYLHESRHRHALNRVRGSGGRFLSTKNLQQTNPSPTSVKHGASDVIPSHQKNTPLDLESHSGTGRSVASHVNFSVAFSNGLFRHPEHSFSGISTNINGGLQSSGSFIHGVNQHCASVIR